jgi:spore germination cell wall hydrolase CwlJ-like protein
MNKIAAIATGTAVVAVLGFQQLEIQAVHEDVQEIKQILILQSKERMNYTKADLECLTKNIYHEAGVESVEGKFAVAQVTLNRLKTGRWGNTICKVVYAPSQFSWTMYKKQRHAQPKGPLWDQSHMVAKSFLEQGYRVPKLEDSTYYHADYVKPYWTPAVEKVAQIGQHIFYKKV